MQTLGMHTLQLSHVRLPPSNLIHPDEQENLHRPVPTIPFGAVQGSLDQLNLPQPAPQPTYSMYSSQNVSSCPPMTEYATLLSIPGKTWAMAPVPQTPIAADTTTIHDLNKCWHHVLAVIEELQSEGNVQPIIEFRDSFGRNQTCAMLLALASGNIFLEGSDPASNTISLGNSDLAAVGNSRHSTISVRTLSGQSEQCTEKANIKVRRSSAVEGRVWRYTFRGCPTNLQLAVQFSVVDFHDIWLEGKMPPVPSISPATGVNLSGSSKAPVDQPSYILDNFWESAEYGGKTFIGRPLDLEDGSADVHLARLRGWGFNMLRFPITWEALEHEGPGTYDYEFMDYTVRVLRKCEEYGFKVYIDPHQDTAAIIHSEYPIPSAATPASLPSTNYGRLLSQTILTLFFAGRDFAPKCIIDGKNIQDYLQEHYIEAMGQMTDRIRDAGDLLEECVTGWDSMNEPFEGFCGWEDLNANPTKQGSTLKKGSSPTPAQSFRLGMGTAQTVDNWNFGTFGPSENGSVTIDPNGDKMG
ncbi:hypothetical protein F5879DRAFT_1066202 [Lentinula edodes]|nr:hypothetical protein F5879DRAFT_1066202 [Lentinula edodes]